MNEGAKHATNDVARDLIRRLLSGESPEAIGVAAEACGEWAGIVAELFRTYAVPSPHGGTAGVRKAFGAAAGADQRLAELVADGGASAESEALPEIIVGTDMKPIVNAAESALLSAGVGIYQRARMLARVTTDGAQIKGIERAPDTPTIEPVPRAWLREEMGSSAQWRSQSKDGVRNVQPPMWAVDTLLARGSWQFLYLTAVVESPCLRADGTVLDTPGYDERTGLLYLPSCNIPAIPENPSQADAQRALGTLSEPFADFPFAAPDSEETSEKTSWAATLAAALTPFARHAIDGCVPMFSVSAPTRGTGKTLLVDTLSLIATGRLATRATQADDDAEERKRLVALCLAGDSVVLLDNVERPLRSTVLSMALTARAIRDRLLGGNLMVTVPMNGVWFVTGNNLQFRGDLSRRVVPILLDPSVEFPEERAGFRHDDLLGWVQQERGRLVAAALTILRAFVVAGKPQQKLTPYGSFEQWAMLVRTCVAWLTGIDPTGGRKALREQDTDHETLSALLATWANEVGEGPKKRATVAQLVERCEAAGGLYDADATALRDALGALCTDYDGKRLDRRRIGYALRQYRDRIAEGRALRRGEKGKAGAEWWVEKIG